MQSFGALRPRLLFTGTCGEQIDGHSFSLEFDSLEDYGGFEATLELARRWDDFVEGHDAIGTSLLTAVHAGSQTGLLVSVAEYPDDRTWGRCAAALSSDPEAPAMASEFAGASSPADIACSGVYIDVPIG